jgi:hypothetical protein
MNKSINIADALPTSPRASRIASYSGGIFSRPDLVTSYANASRALLLAADTKSRLRDLGMPIFYLQRHTVELAIKQILCSLLSLRDEDAELEAANHKAWEELVSSRKTTDEAFGHDLGDLIQKTEALLKQRSLPSLPTEFHSLEKMINTFEQGAAERARYDSVAYGRGKDRQVAPSLPRGTPTTLPIGDLQDLIDSLLGGPLHFRSFEDDTFIASLAAEAEASTQALQRQGRI